MNSLLTQNSVRSIRNIHPTSQVAHLAGCLQEIIRSNTSGRRKGYRQRVDSRFQGGLKRPAQYLPLLRKTAGGGYKPQEMRQMQFPRPRRSLLFQVGEFCGTLPVYLPLTYCIGSVN